MLSLEEDILTEAQYYIQKSVLNIHRQETYVEEDENEQSEEDENEQSKEDEDYEDDTGVCISLEKLLRFQKLQNLCDLQILR